MSIENGNRPSDLSPKGEKELSPKSQPNPLRWRGEAFKVVVKEEEREGEKHLVMGAFDGQEMIVFDFSEHVRRFSTTFLPAGEVGDLFEADTLQEDTPAPGSPTLPSETDQARPEKQAPTKISGKIREVGELGKTKKQEKPMLLFTVWDSENKMERRMVAFETVAEQLASPDTDLQPDEDITLFAHKHVNTVHVRGKEKEVEDWYVQAAVYQDKRYEKPRNKRKKE